MNQKEFELLDKIDDLARNYEFCYESENVPNQLPIDEKGFNTEATKLLKIYSKENALFFGTWILENEYFIEFGQYRQKPSKFSGYYTIEQLYDLFEENLKRTVGK